MSETTVIRIPAKDLRAGDQVILKGGRLREMNNVWISRGACLFAGSRARVQTVQATYAGGTMPMGWDLDDMLTVVRTGS